MDFAINCHSERLCQFTFPLRACGEDPFSPQVQLAHRSLWPRVTNGNTHLPIGLPFGREQEGYFLSQLHSQDKKHLGLTLLGGRDQFHKVVCTNQKGGLWS